MTDTRADVLWLVRHGDREDFVDPDWGLTAARPQDPGLAPSGVEQARAVGVRLHGEGIRRIFTSPYLRCAQTAHVVAERLNVPVHVEPGLGELNHPDWSQGLPELLPLRELAELTGAFDATHLDVHQRCFPETIEQAFARAANTARAITALYVGPLLFVAHAVSILGIVRALTDATDDVACPTASLFLLERAGVSWKLTLSGDTSHLSVAHGADRFH